MWYPSEMEPKEETDHEPTADHNPRVNHRSKVNRRPETGHRRQGAPRKKAPSPSRSDHVSEAVVAYDAQTAGVRGVAPASGRTREDTEIGSTYTVHLGDRGRMVLPARARRELGLEAGSRLILTVEEPGVFRVSSPRAAADRGLGLLRELAGERSLAGELIAERRQDAGRD